MVSFLEFDISFLQSQTYCSLDLFTVCITWLSVYSWAAWVDTVGPRTHGSARLYDCRSCGCCCVPSMRAPSSIWKNLPSWTQQALSGVLR
ncbi:hypothetical protein XELAEV_18045832mg [Xenopus laevis]|uniref:Uncharacterized protein n=1 Tax=Xenopus laevis TaxID=8355 RepID=A0A974BS04_XENLA|nr:hypothetical protein XELAEV_18045832mg [Xenopus laevis]